MLLKRLLFIVVLFFFSCEPGEEFLPTNPLDPDNEEYIPPEVTILYPSEGVIVEQSSVNFQWAGNQADMQFRYSFDNEWSDWVSDEAVTINYIDEGVHTFSVQSSYLTGAASEIATINFNVDAVTGPAIMFYPRKHIGAQGSNVVFQIMAEEVYDLAAAEFRITFNPEDLQVNSLTQGSGFSTMGDVVFISDIDNTNGSVTISTAVWGQNYPSISGTSDIAILDVQIIKQGTHQLELDGTELFRDPSNNDITINETVDGLVVVE